MVRRFARLLINDQRDDEPGILGVESRSVAVMGNVKAADEVDDVGVADLTHSSRESRPPPRSRYVETPSLPSSQGEEFSRGTPVRLCVIPSITQVGVALLKSNDVK